MLPCINKQHLTWLSERFVGLGQSMHFFDPKNLSRAQTNQTRMPEIFTWWSKTQEFRTQNSFSHRIIVFVRRNTFILEGTLVESVSPGSCAPLTVQQDVPQWIPLTFMLKFLHPPNGHNKICLINHTKTLWESIEIAVLKVSWESMKYCINMSNHQCMLYSIKFCEVLLRYCFLIIEPTSCVLYLFQWL